MASKSATFQFRPHDSIGSADAEQDNDFLESCFVDTGDLGIIRDCENPRRIVVGRTGSGKTALLLRLADEETNVISVKPESLALTYISNSTVLNFVLSLGVKLDIFFRLLWRHVFTVEVIKAHFQIDSEADKNKFIEWVEARFRDKKHKRVIEYLEKFGTSFWEETEYRVKEVTTRLESDLETTLGGSVGWVTGKLKGAQSLSEEQKQEIIHRAQSVVNSIQIRELSEIIDLLGDILAREPQKRYFLTIDRLDEDWIEDRLRYHLVRALIETVRDFRKARSVKIVVALRYDLLDRVFRITRDPGFQEDKYESLLLPLQWDKPGLVGVLDTRINRLVEQRYTKQTVKYEHLLPKRVKPNVPTIDYILDRTFMRPRDVIQFFNLCIVQAKTSPTITLQMFRIAEGEYSRTRLRALAEEWYADYPELMAMKDVLKNRPPRFSVRELTHNDCGDLCLNYVIGGGRRSSELGDAAYNVVQTDMTVEEFRSLLVQVFFKVGLVGIRSSAKENYIWSAGGFRRSISIAEIHPTTKVSIHPCFWRTLGVRDAGSQEAPDDE